MINRVSVWKGKQLSEDHKKKISLSLKGRMPKFIPNNTGRILSTETKKKIRLGNLGKKMSKKSRIKMSLGRKGKYTDDQSWTWKGSEVGYSALHKWVKRHLGKAKKCINNPLHKFNKYEWANISGEYKRDLSDWHELCITCNRNDGIKIPERLKYKKSI